MPLPTLIGKKPDLISAAAYSIFYFLLFLMSGDIYTTVIYIPHYPNTFIHILLKTLKYVRITSH